MITGLLRQLGSARIGGLSLLFSFSLFGFELAYAQDATLDIVSASQSSTAFGGVAGRAIDGNTSGRYWNRSVTHTNHEYQPWLTVDLGLLANVADVEVYNRTDNCCTSRLTDFFVQISQTPFLSTNLDTSLVDPSIWSRYHEGEIVGSSLFVPAGVVGRYIRIQMKGRKTLSLAEVVVSGSPLPPENLPPIAVNDTATVDSDSSVIINVLSNDSDSDGSGTLTVALDTGPSHGTALVQSGGTILYTPASGVITETIDSFTYTATNDDGESSVATVTVNIIPVIEGAIVLTPVSAEQSSTAYGGVAGRAVDGNTSGRYWNRSVTHTNQEYQPWWTGDLGLLANVVEVDVYNRTDNCCTSRLRDFYVLISKAPFLSNDLDANLNDPSIWSSFHEGEMVGSSLSVPVGVAGRYIRIQMKGRKTLSLAEIIVSGVPIPNICAAADSKNETVSVLLIGNSLMGGIQPRVEELLTCGGYSPHMATSNPGGYRLNRHVTNEQTLNLIAEGYDLTLLQEQSGTIPYHFTPYTTITSLKNLIEAAGSEMGLYQTWAFQDRDPSDTNAILTGYEEVAAYFNAPLFEFGRAFDDFYINYNEFPPFSLFSDRVHATDNGRALIAYLLYAYLTGETPVSLSSLTLSDEDAFILQSHAWDTYQLGL